MGDNYDPRGNFGSWRHQHFAEEAPGGCQFEEKEAGQGEGENQWACRNKNGRVGQDRQKGKYLVMDNAPVQLPKVIRETIEGRGYKCVYLPPYSAFLNRIEEFWSKVKAGIRRNALNANDQLTP